MRVIELRDAAPALSPKKWRYEKVVNPENPSEFVYVESAFLQRVRDEAAQNGMSGFFNDVWNGITGAVGGFVSSGGNPIAAIGGAIQGVKSGHTTPVAVSPSANSGAPSITLTAPANAAPAVVQASSAIRGRGDDPGAKDNTLLYVGLGAAALLLISRKR